MSLPVRVIAFCIAEHLLFVLTSFTQRHLIVDYLNKEFCCKMPLPWHYKTAEISMFYSPEMRQMFCFSHQSILMPKELGTFLHCLMWVGSLVSFNVISLLITPVQERLWCIQLTYFIVHIHYFYWRRVAVKVLNWVEIWKSSKIPSQPVLLSSTDQNRQIIESFISISSGPWVLFTTHQNTSVSLT